jgi:hypothetical protein
MVALLPPFSAAFLSTVAPLTVEPDSDTYLALPHNGRGLLLLSILVLLLLLVVLRIFFRYRNRPLDVFTNASGSVRVSRSALADLVENAALQYGVVARPRVAFTRRSGQLHLDVRLKLASGQRLPDFSAGLQTHLANTLRDAFGLEALGGIHLTVTGFKGRATIDAPDVPEFSRVSPPAAAAPASKPTAGNDFFTR